MHYLQVMNRIIYFLNSIHDTSSMFSYTIIMIILLTQQIFSIPKANQTLIFTVFRSGVHAMLLA